MDIFSHGLGDEGADRAMPPPRIFRQEPPLCDSSSYLFSNDFVLPFEILY